MNTSLPPQWPLWRFYLLISFIGSIALPLTMALPITVEISVTPLSGSYQYDVSIKNPGPDDVSIVSLVDAPLFDPLIDATLTTPADFLGAYDSGLGIVDFLEFTGLFAAGTTVSGFSFESLGSPAHFFKIYESLTIFGEFGTGLTVVTINPGTPVPETGSGLLLAGISICSLILARKDFFVRKQITNP